MLTNVPAKAGDVGDGVSIPGSGRALEEEMATHSSISCLETFHGQRSLVRCSPWGLKQLNPTERPNTRAHTMFSGMDI